MMPFTPFDAPGQVMSGPSGPYAASFREAVEGSLIEWTAKKVGPEESGEPVG